MEVLAFDVNETLLDLKGLDAHFVTVFGDASLRPVWFQAMLQLSFVGGLTGHYVDFTTAQHAALRMTSQRAGHDLSQDEAKLVVGGMSTLPPHPEIVEALTRLRGAGFRQVTLTNSPLAVVRDQLAFAGLTDLFDDILSADEVQQLKPGPAPYRLVANRMRVPLAEVRLIAAHSWDVSGALAAGALAAFVARPGAVMSPLGLQPDISGKDLQEIATLLLSR